MKKQLSILIPTYNDVAIDAVRTLAQQAAAIEGLTFEIIVADDGSTRAAAIEANRAIDRLPGCRLIRRETNEGRAAIRNFLAREARMPWLLFIDSGMGIPRADFVERYLSAEGDPIYGGYIVTGDATQLSGNLRYRYEKAVEEAHRPARRQKHPDRDFHTSNFLVSKALFESHPLDERFRRYGYEDVLWGKQLAAEGITITHIDNPVDFDRFESNTDFLRKTDEGLDTLAAFGSDLGNYSRLLRMAHMLERLRLQRLLVWLYDRKGESWRQRLTGAHPSLRLLKIYKLCRLISLRAGRKPMA